jgi:hypothetical protein
LSKISPDGLEALRAEIGVKEICSLIERTARWVAPETFKLLPVWFPAHGRGHRLYKSNWSEAQFNTNRVTQVTSHKAEANIYASRALTSALGLQKSERRNWSCCHIWGIDDDSFQQSNEIVKDRRFFTCVANMLLLPTPLKAFTDSMPEVKAMLRICSRNLYNWTCDHESLVKTVEDLDVWADWENYPHSWPRAPNEKRPLGTMELTEQIERRIQQRRAEIKRELETAGPHYPRTDVKNVLAYWNIEL